MIKNNKNLLITFLIAVSFAQCATALSKDEAISFVKEKANALKEFAKEHKKKLIAATIIAIPTAMGIHLIYCVNSDRRYDNASTIQKIKRYSLVPLAVCQAATGLSSAFLNAGAEILTTCAEKLENLENNLIEKLRVLNKKYFD